MYLHSPKPSKNLPLMEIKWIPDFFFYSKHCLRRYFKTDTRYSSILKPQAHHTFGMRLPRKFEISCLFSQDCDTNSDNHTFNNKQTASIWKIKVISSCFHFHKVYFSCYQLYHVGLQNKCTQNTSLKASDVDY